MYFKKAMSLLLVLALVATSVFANGANESSQPADGGKVTLDVMWYGDNSTAEGARFEEIKALYMEENPNVEIIGEQLYDEAYHQKLRARIAGADLPDVFYIWPGARTQYVRNAGAAANLNDYIDFSEYQEGARVAQDVNGERYMIPQGINITSVLYMNDALAAELGVEAPETYQDLVDLVEPLAAQGIDVISLAGADSWVMNSIILGTLVGRFTGEADFIVKAVAGEPGYSFEDPKFVQALEFLEQMFEDGVLPATAISTDYGTSVSRFINGQALFTLDGQWRTGAFEDPAFQEVVSMHVFPAIPGEDPAMAGSVSGVVSPGYGISSNVPGDEAKLAAAIDFLNYINSEEESLFRLEAQALIPARLMDLPDEVPVLVTEKQAFYNAVKVVSTVPDSQIGGQANDNLNAGMQKIALGQTTPAEVAAQLEADIRN